MYTFHTFMVYVVHKQSSEKSFFFYFQEKHQLAYSQPMNPSTYILTPSICSVLFFLSMKTVSRMQYKFTLRLKKVLVTMTTLPNKNINVRIYQPVFEDISNSILYITSYSMLLGFSVQYYVYERFPLNENSLSENRTLI